MEAAARGDRVGSLSLLEVARRGGRDSTLEERLGEWWAELRQQVSVLRHEEARRQVTAGNDEGEGSMGWEDWDGADQDHDGGARARTNQASRKAMAALRVPELRKTREQNCAVCLEDFVSGGGELRTMPCSHSFHQQCIFDWLLVQRRCPMCRFEMPSRTDDEDDDEEREADLVGG